MFGLYAGTGEPTPNRNRFVFERGGCSFVIPFPIFWRFPVAPTCLRPSCVLPACVRPPYVPCSPFPVPVTPVPVPVPVPNQSKRVFEDTKRHCFNPVPILGRRNISQGIEKEIDLPIVYKVN